MNSGEPAIGVSILGGTGYGAGELLRYLAFHPAAQIVSVVSRSMAREELAEAHPHLEGIYQDCPFTTEIDFTAMKSFEKRVVFSALPHAATPEQYRKILSHLEDLEATFIDLSGAFRLRNPLLHDLHYPEVQRTEAEQDPFTYGLPELFGPEEAPELLLSKRIANPGCLATASILAALPLCSFGEPFPSALVFDTKTGSSGSGRELKSTTHHPSRHSNFTAYKPLEHQHHPEILQALGDPAIRSSFVAQSLPVARGIYITLHALYDEPISASSLESNFAECCRRSPFLRFREKPPHLQDVVGTNFCDLSLTVKDDTALICAAIDNLGKGMAGQAIQNMNILFDLPQETGLLIPSYRPA